MSLRSLLLPFGMGNWTVSSEVQATGEPQGVPIMPGRILTPGSGVSIPMRSAGW